MGKTFALSLILLLALSNLIMAESANAQSIPKPIVSEFVSLIYVETSYYVPPNYVIDPPTGQNISVKEGYNVYNPTIVAKIRNQPFTPYSYTLNNSTSKVYLYYNFRYKGHTANEWIYYPISESGLSTHRYSAMFYKFADFPNFTASSTDYSVIPINFFTEPPSAGTKVDFQVQAQIGNIQSLGDGYYSFTGESSGWSNTQTISIPESSISTSTPTPSYNPTTNPTDTISDNSLASLLTSLALVAVAVSAVVVVSLLLYIRHLKRSIAKPDNSAVYD